MKIEIKNRWNNEVLFTHEVENNTIKITSGSRNKAANISRRFYFKNSSNDGRSIWNSISN